MSNVIMTFFVFVACQEGVGLDETSVIRQWYRILQNPCNMLQPRLPYMEVNYSD